MCRERECVAPTSANIRLAFLRYIQNILFRFHYLNLRRELHMFVWLNPTFLERQYVEVLFSIVKKNMLD